MGMNSLLLVVLRLNQLELQYFQENKILPCCPCADCDALDPFLVDI
jgi:hypothetical protein